MWHRAAFALSGAKLFYNPCTYRRKSNKTAKICKIIFWIENNQPPHDHPISSWHPLLQKGFHFRRLEKLWSIFHFIKRVSFQLSSIQSNSVYSFQFHQSWSHATLPPIFSLCKIPKKNFPQLWSHCTYILVFRTQVSFLAKRNKIWSLLKKRVHFGSSEGLGDFWGDLHLGPDLRFLDGIRALLGSGAFTGQPVKILLQLSGGWGSISIFSQV